MADWHTRREMSLVNQGLECKITLEAVREVEGRFRLTVIEKIIGGLPTVLRTTTHEHEDAIREFKAVASHYVGLDPDVSELSHMDAGSLHIHAEVRKGLEE